MKEYFLPKYVANAYVTMATNEPRSYDVRIKSSKSS